LSESAPPLSISKVDISVMIGKLSKIAL